MKICRLIVLLGILVNLASCFRDADLPVPHGVDKEQLLWGQELVRGLAACGACHGMSSNPDAPLSGGQTMIDRYGEVAAPNITPSTDGIGGWTLSDLSRALRSARGIHDEYLSIEAHSGYEWLADYDLFAILTYVRALPPVDGKVPHRDITLLDRNTVGFFDKWTEVQGYIPRIKRGPDANWGRYLVNHVARCGSCHDLPATLLRTRRYLAGGQTIVREGVQRIAPNITADKEYGIGAWSEDEIVYYLQTGRTPGNRIVSPDFCPTRYYRNANVDDLRAMAKFLRALNP